MEVNAKYYQIGWAQVLADGKLLLMETQLPRTEIHDNGRNMYPLFIDLNDTGKTNGS